MTTGILAHISVPRFPFRLNIFLWKIRWDAAKKSCHKIRWAQLFSKTQSMKERKIFKNPWGNCTLGNWDLPQKLGTWFSFPAELPGITCEAKQYLPSLQHPPQREKHLLKIQCLLGPWCPDNPDTQKVSQLVPDISKHANYYSPRFPLTLTWSQLSFSNGDVCA